jgi:hypothetical protein
MKKIVCHGLSYCISLWCLCQSNEDSILLAHSEKWKVQQHKGLFGLSKPEFGAYRTLDATRFDSSVIKKKTKDSSSVDIESSREETDIDHSKFLTIEKTKFYRLRLATDADTVEAIFSISSVSKEKKQTFLGKILSKHDEGKDVVLSYNRDVSGVIKMRAANPPWEFFIDDFTSGGRQTANNPYPSASISGGYLRSDEDSLYMELYSSFSADLVLVNKNGEHVAAIEFKQKPFNIWIRSDIENSGQKAIAVLFAVIMAIKDF